MQPILNGNTPQGERSASRALGWTSARCCAEINNVINAGMTFLRITIGLTWTMYCRWYRYYSRFIRLKQFFARARRLHVRHVPQGALWHGRARGLRLHAAAVCLRGGRHHSGPRQGARLPQGRQVSGQYSVCCTNQYTVYGIRCTNVRSPGSPKDTMVALKKRIECLLYYRAFVAGATIQDLVKAVTLPFPSTTHKQVFLLYMLAYKRQPRLSSIRKQCNISSLHEACKVIVLYMLAHKCRS
jgi:hypothetical protein